MKSIKIKIILYVGILLIAALAASSIINDLTFKNNAVNLTEDAISRRCMIFTDTIEGTIANMEVAAHSLAALGTLVHENYKTNPDLNYRALISDYLTDYLITDTNAAGYGLWFEKDVFANDPYVGPYAFWGDTGVELTFDYEDPSYDFHTSEWYTTILPESWDRTEARDGFFLTKPFYDEVLDVTFITMGRVINDSDGRIIGAVTDDWTLDFIGDLLADLQITETSFPFLLDNKNGLILYHPDTELIGKPLNQIEWAGSLTDPREGVVQVITGLDHKDRIHTVYYAGLSVGYTFGFLVPDREAYAFLTILRRNNIAIAVLLIIISSVVVYFISGRIVRPIRMTTNTIRGIAEGEGNLNVRVEVGSRDELGELATNFNNFVAKLRGIVVAVKNAGTAVGQNRDELVSNAEETASATVEINGNVNSIKNQIERLNGEIQSITRGMKNIQSAVEGLNNSTSSQSAAVEQASASTEEMIAQLNSVARIVQEKKEVTVALTGTITQSGEAIRKATTANHEIVELASQISEMSKVISDIASQTNLLSMNAAIEAAHAGDSGRGFAVVAEEIRKLAENSQTNSANIARITKDILTKVDVAFEVSQESEKAFGLLKDEIKGTIQALEEINGNTQELTQGGEQIIISNSELNKVSLAVQEEARKMESTIQEISQAVTGAADISTQVNAGMDEISHGTSEIAQAMSFVQNISGKLSQSTGELEREMGKFKTDE